MTLKEQVIATIKHTKFQPGGLKFSVGMGSMNDGFTEDKQAERFYVVRIERVDFLGARNEKMVVEFTRTTNWDDGKETGPMVLDTVEVTGDAG